MRSSGSATAPFTILPNRVGTTPSRRSQVLFQFCYWFACTYGRDAKPSSGLRFDPGSLPDPRVQKGKTAAEIEALRDELEQAAERRSWPESSFSVRRGLRKRSRLFERRSPA